MCCVCLGTCSHVGNHSFCYAHTPGNQQWLWPSNQPSTILYLFEQINKQIEELNRRLDKLESRL